MIMYLKPIETLMTRSLKSSFSLAEIRLDKIQPEQKTAIPAKVVHVNPAGPLIKVELERTDGQLIQAEITQEVRDLLSIHKNDLLWVSPKNFKIYAN